MIDPLTLTTRDSHLVLDRLCDDDQYQLVSVYHHDDGPGVLLNANQLRQAGYRFLAAAEQLVPTKQPDTPIWDELGEPPHVPDPVAFEEMWDAAGGEDGGEQ